MGCDIHLHTEIRLSDNSDWLHYSHPYIARDYRLFSKMAGVRQDEEWPIQPIVAPKGRAENLSMVTWLDTQRWNGDGHNHSWLDHKEIAELSKWVEDFLIPKTKWKLEMDYWGYLFQSCWDEELPILIRNTTPEIHIHDVRFVFWFDN